MPFADVLRRRLTQRYVLALSLVALLALLAQGLVQVSLSQQSADAREINLAGRQRMLSQRIAKHALRAAGAQDPSAALAALDADVETWRAAHRGLLGGDAELGLPGLAGRPEHAALSALSGRVEAVAEASQALRAARQAGTSSDAALDALLGAEEAFLPGMDAVVFALDGSARRGVLWLRWIEGVILLVTLVVLYLEARLVFRPAVAWAEAAVRRRGAAFQFHVATDAEDDVAPEVLRTFRFLSGFGAVVIPAFGLGYHILDPAYVDPPLVRAAWAVLLAGLCGLTFVSGWMRAHVRGVAALVALGLTAYFSALAGLNGLDAPWALGAFACLCATSVVVALHAPHAGSLLGGMVLLAVLSAGGVLVGGAETAVPRSLFVAYSVFLTALIGAAGYVRLRASEGVREGRRQLDRQRRVLRAVLDGIPNGLYVVDRSGRFLTSNAIGAEWAPAETPDALAGRALADVFSVPVAEAVSDGLDAVLGGREAPRAVVPTAHPDGTPMTVRTLVTPFYDDAGEVGGAVCLVYDMTAEETANAAAAESEALSRTILDAAPDLIVVLDEDDTVLQVNPAAAEVLGRDAAEMVGQGLADLAVPERFRDEHRAKLRRYATLDEPGSLLRRLRLPVVHADGAEIPTELTFRPIRLGSGRTLFVMYIRDMRLQEAAEAELRAARDAAEQKGRLLRTVIDAIPDMIWVTDRLGRCVLRNAADAAAIGYDDPAESLGLTVFDTMPDRAEALWALDREIIETGRPRINADDVVVVDGQERVYRSSKVPLTDEDGDVTGLVGIVRDVTEARAAEAELVEARDAAEAATRAKSEFLANMSHEIRTPMNGVIGMTSLLLDTPLDAEQADFVETIRSSGDALLTLINDILDFSKIEAGMLDLEEAPFDVRAVLESALDLVAQSAADKGIELAYIVAESVPQTARGDATRMRQVLVNLLSNAIKFTHRGSVCVRAEAAPTSASPSDGPATIRLSVSVEDTGIGIPADKLEAVFGSFEQADASTTRQFGGTGLGLAICRRLVEMMGGEISVTSEVGQGSTFSFSVAVGVVPTERRVFLRADQPVLRGKRMLVVDDNDVNREILVRLAARWHMSVEAFASGQAAVDAVRAGARFDVAVLDMQMPGVDGLDTARGLGEAVPHKLLLTSINRDAALRDAAAAAGIARVLYKPAKPAQIHDALEEALRGQPHASPQAAWVAGGRRGAPPEAAERVVSPLRVLLAEDNVVNQKVALRILKKLGYTADVASNGVEALAAVHRQPYDVVLMDVQMPEMDGLEATRRLRAELGEAQPVVVALTANVMTGDREACLAAGCDAYLSKPIQVPALAAALAEVPAPA